MASTNPLLAANPSQNAIVKASAGVGKTYLLVTRLIRLLLKDVPPDAILAITFTRKAAAEMQSRLYERLHELAICDEKSRCELLTNIGVECQQDTLSKAQTLYETILQCTQQVKCTTFHAFCQEILQKFPLEADVPPGFELLEDTATYQQTAWEILYDEATQMPDSIVANSMETLFDLTGGLQNTHNALNNFLEQRADWWAFTHGAANNFEYACQLLAGTLNYSPSENYFADIFNSNVKQKLYRIIELWKLHDTKTNLVLIDKLQQILVTEVFDDTGIDNSQYEAAFEQMWNVFFNTKNVLRESEPKKARAKKMGDDGEQEFLELFRQITSRMEAVKEKQNREFNYRLNQAWYITGNRLIEIYQEIKAEQRLLDFTDLEWKTYKLLNHSDNALWVQYKLDQRIRHLLVDEFQDTNPTQWRLLLPIMEEFEFQQEDPRSVFIVGDEKQSIYSFRRADPALLHQASDWMREHLGGAEFPMDKSRRSSPEIMNLVNTIFKSEQYQKTFNAFTSHSTHLNKLPGWLQLLPLVEPIETETEEIIFRNPLEHPREEYEDPAFYEGQLLANTINQLVNNKITVHENGSVRSVQFQDIMILVRSRRHVTQFERALREAGIPYISNNKGTLFGCREIQDMIALLTVLYSPHNDIALATLLRSPIFGCTSQDLLYFYQTDKKISWYELLTSADKECSESLLNAKNKLIRWREAALQLPIHDILDRIYFEADIIQCYANTFPGHLVERAKNNLLQFLSLALQIDSGRYPSLGRFLSRLEHLRQLDASPDEAVNSSSANAIRILTIHASKGLEAPIVFLADTCDAKRSNSKHYQALVQWPQDEKKPNAFRLCPVKKNHDASIKILLSHIERKEIVEDANLLYVALTRARQALYVSGTSYSGEAKGWYKIIRDNWPVEANQKTPQESNVVSLSTTPDSSSITLPPLFQDSTVKLVIDEQENAEDSQLRGIIIHRALELLTQSDKSSNHVLKQLINEFGQADDIDITALCDEAVKVVEHSEFSNYFRLVASAKAFNEIPIHCCEDNTTKHGIIDRLIITDSECHIIDYKTHSSCDKSQLKQIANYYTKQMDFYRNIISQMWPEKHIKCHILFTHFLTAIEL